MLAKEVSLQVDQVWAAGWAVWRHTSRTNAGLMHYSEISQHPEASYKEQLDIKEALVSQINGKQERHKEDGGSLSLFLFYFF